MANSFFSNGNESSLEKGNFVTQSTKNAAKSSQGYVKQQSDEVKQESRKQMIDFLYGNTADASKVDKHDDPIPHAVDRTLDQLVPQSGDENGQDAPDALAQQLQKSQSGGSTSSASSMSQLMPAQNSEEQSKLDDTRDRLASLNSSAPKGASGLHRQHMPENLRKLEYIEETFGENAKRRRTQEEEQKAKEKEQEEEEEKERLEKEKQEQEQELDGGLSAEGKAPTGPGAKTKKKGMNKMQRPLALKQAQNKSEVGRGTKG